MITTPWSENSPHQGITFPRGRSTGVENGLNILGWETWVYELGPFRGQAHSFHSSGWGWNIEPPAWDRRSLLKGSSRGGPLRRDIISGNHTLASHRGAMRSSKTRSRRTISRTPGSRAIGGNAYRRSHAHVCTITSSPIWMHVGETVWTVRCLSRRKQIHLCLAELSSYQLHHLWVEPPFPGLQPLSWQDVCSYIVDPLGCKLLEETATTLGTTGGFGMPVCNVDVTANPPGDLCRRPPMCCLIGWAQGGPCDLLENSWEQEIQPTSLEVWCSSSPFMCHERWWSFHRLWLERPSKIIPQPAREASVHNQIVEVSVPLSGWKKPQRVLPNP